MQNVVGLATKELQSNTQSKEINSLWITMNSYLEICLYTSERDFYTDFLYFLIKTEGLK